MIEFDARQIGHQHYDMYAVWSDGVVMCASEIPFGVYPSAQDWVPSIRPSNWVRDNAVFEGYDNPPCQPRIGL